MTLNEWKATAELEDIQKIEAIEEMIGRKDLNVLLEEAENWEYYHGMTGEEWEINYIEDTYPEIRMVLDCGLDSFIDIDYQGIADWEESDGFIYESSRGLLVRI